MDGVLIIDKPAGLTSHDVVARVRRILRERKVGHTGTLDPFATGVLVVLVGRATRLAQFLAGADKEYEALIRFGFATETGDLTGAPLTASDADGPTARERVKGWSKGEVEAALSSLRGEIEQVPPMYSAKRVQGKRLYELARSGVEIERAAVRVRIYELEAVRESDEGLLRFNGDGTCDLRVRVRCSSGTYVRALAESVGEHLGVGAHLAELRRTHAGAFGLEEAITLEGLEERGRAGDAADALLPPISALQGWPSVHLTGEEAERARHGIALRVTAEDEGKYRDGQGVGMTGEGGDLIAVAIYEAATRFLRPRVVLATEK